MSIYTHWSSKLENEQSPFLEKGETEPAFTSRRLNTVFSYCASFVFGLSLFLNIMLLSQQWSPRNWDKTCTEHTMEYDSPITDRIDITYQTTSFDGSFMKESKYTLPPSVDVEQAWRELGTHLRHVVIPEDKAERYGIDTDLLKVSPNKGGGYPVLFEFQHHLHCLNLLRQTSWFNFQHYNATQVDGYQDGEEMVRKHIGHCVNQLRQVLMCNPDIGMLGQVWVDNIDGPFVNFNDTQHKCKNWDDISRVASELQVPEGMTPQISFRNGDRHIPSVP